MTTNIKDPDATLDYLFNWGQWLAAGETISTQVVTISPAGLTNTPAATIVAGTERDGTVAASGAVLVWLVGGTAGTDYAVACKITTSASRTDERTMTIRVRQR